MESPIKVNDRLRIENGKLLSPFGEEVPENELVMVMVVMDDALIARTGLTARTQYTSVSQGRICFMTGAVPLAEIPKSVKIYVTQVIPITITQPAA